MPIRCRAEHDGDGIALSEIPCMADAESFRNFFAESGIPAMITQPHSPHDYRVYVGGMTLGTFVTLIARAAHREGQCRVDRRETKTARQTVKNAVKIGCSTGSWLGAVLRQPHTVKNYRRPRRRRARPKSRPLAAACRGAG